MPPARSVRRSAITNENDENGTTRVTRAKAASLAVPADVVGAKKALQGKKTSANDGLTRKRAALGDVSNVNKGDGAATKEVKEIKKAIVPASKAAQPTGIQKRTTSSRPPLGSRDKNTASNDLKRPASVASTAGAIKKRSITSGSGRRPSSGREYSNAPDENIEPAREEAVKVEVIESIKITTTQADGTEVKKEYKHQETKLKSDDEARAASIAMKIEEMDQDDESDPLMVSEYVYEIIDYMKEVEVTTMPNAAYMDHQKDLDWRMRGVLVDWLLEVHSRFKLLPETFYLTVNIIDRFLSCKVVQIDRLQLVGITAMFIASKYEEVLSPHIQDFRHVAEDSFTEQEILSAERFVLSALNYDLSFPNPMHFMRRISKADDYDIQTRTLAKYLLEITLLDHRFIEFRPSMNAAAAMHLSRIILDKGPWDELLVHYSGYTEAEIEPIYATMLDYLSSPVVHNALYKKYAHKMFFKASLHARAWAKKYAQDCK